LEGLLIEIDITPSYSDLEHIALLSNLRALCIGRLNDTGLTHLANLQQLRNLTVILSPITDISAVASLPQLEELYLAGTDVTDAGIIPVSQMPKLKRLILDWNYHLSAAAVEALRTANRDLDIKARLWKPRLEASN
jgi:hypothetical protein